MAEVYTFIFHKTWKLASRVKSADQPVHVCCVEDENGDTTLWISIMDLFSAADIAKSALRMDAMVQRLPASIPIAKIPFHSPNYNHTVSCANPLGALLMLYQGRTSQPRHTTLVQDWLLTEVFPRFFDERSYSNPRVVKLPDDIPHEDACLLSPKSVYIIPRPALVVDADADTDDVVTSA